MQSSLPAGWLAFTGRELNPLDRYKRFQIIHPPFLDLAWRKGSVMRLIFIGKGCSSAIARELGSIARPCADTSPVVWSHRLTGRGSHASD